MASVCVPPFFQASALAYGLQCFMMNDTTLDVFSDDPDKLQQWVNMNHITAECIGHAMVARHLSTPNLFSMPNDLQEHVQNAASSPYFTISQLRTIYSIPAPTSSSVVVGVVSFGGGLYGTVDANGVLTNGDVQTYWSSIGIAPANHPKVIIVPLQGARNLPNSNDGGSTIENTIDVQTIGGICPTSKLTIILYISPNSLSQFPIMLNYMYNTPVIVGGVSYKPDVVSCSWGAPEVYYPSSVLSSINAIMSTMANAGINICVATGDNGSNDGVGGSTNYVDFPSSNPNALAVGGTALVCPNRVYDGETIETAWSSGGGGISRLYAKPSYQSELSGTGRSTPDISMVADPNTGVLFIINGQTQAIGGTSVAAPIIAGFLAAINYKTFITPILYRAPNTCFHEILTGSNGGYYAGLGFDNVTGWGTLNGTGLATYLFQPPTTIPVSSIVLNPTQFTLLTGQTSPVTTTVFPVNATNPALRWSTTDVNIAYASTNSIIHAISPGKVQLTATSTDGSNVSSTITVIVSPILVSSIAISPQSVSIAPGQSATLSASVLPLNAYQPSVQWSSSQPAIATVSNGVVTAVSVGSTVIKAQSIDGSMISASLTITVHPLVIPATSIGISQLSASIIPQDTLQLTATYLPVDATDIATTWSSNNTNASVSQTGLVTANTIGTSMITARTGSLSATCVISVVVPVSSVTISPSTMVIPIGSSKTITPVIQPVNAGIKTITWSSANSGIVSVSSAGVIKAISAGSTTITALVNRKTATLNVLVSVPIQSLLLNTNALTMKRGTTFKAIATIQPSNADNKLITWQTMIPTVAKVDQTGLITAVAVGTTMITAIAQDGGKMASMIVRVQI